MNLWLIPPIIVAAGFVVASVKYARLMKEHGYFGDAIFGAISTFLFGFAVAIVSAVALIIGRTL